MFTCASTNKLDSTMNSNFMLEGVAHGLMPQTVVLHKHRGRKGNKLKRRHECVGEARQNESKIQKKIARLEVRII